MKRFVFVFFAVLLACGSALAAPLSLTADFPDLSVSALSVQWNGSVLTINHTGSSAFNYSPDSMTAPTPSTAATYSLSLSLDSSGNIVAGTNSFEVRDGMGNLLLGGTISQFGFMFTSVGAGSSLGNFQFVVDLTTSDPGLGMGSQLGILVGNGLYSANAADPFASAFGPATVNSDNFRIPAPEPSSLALLLLGGGGLALLRRRRR